MNEFIRQGKEVAECRRRAKRRSFLRGVAMTGAPKAKTKRPRGRRFSLFSNISHSVLRSTTECLYR